MFISLFYENDFVNYLNSLQKKGPELSDPLKLLKNLFLRLQDYFL